MNPHDTSSPARGTATTHQRRIARALLALALPVLAMVSFLAVGEASPPAIPEINLAADPLYTPTSIDKPLLALALSVEFPTVGAQYVDPDANSSSDDPTYSPTIEYLGYYDAESCYTYKNTLGTGETAADKRFVRRGPALPLAESNPANPTWTSRTCWNGTRSYSKDDGSSPAFSTTSNDAFSGNFLNWASSSAIDMLRLSLTGGDRVIDTPTVTVLQRAVIPDGDPIAMGNSSNFPAKRLYRSGTSRAITNTTFAAASFASGIPYFGAVPSAMASAAGTSDIYVANTLNRIYFGLAKSGNTSSNFGSYTLGGPSQGALNGENYFFARVQVCDRDATTYALKEQRYWSLCTQYADGTNSPTRTYKPTGAVQKYADVLRLAAFGYLLDQQTSRVGGVLRSPVKYVGAKTFNINGIENTPAGGNPNQEWNPVTGVFYPNPDNNMTIATTDGRAAYLSGVVSYLNQFGRTGAVPGRYKLYDPVGELYYEALRYLQGLQPTPEAVSGITTAMYDGFPAATSWTDPYGGGRANTGDYSCLKSNILVIGDINTWDYTDRLPTASAANNIPDIAYWQDIVANFESNAGGTYVDGQGVTRTIANPNTPNSAALTCTTCRTAAGTVSVVGTAYWAHSHDIRGTGWTNATSNGSAGTTLQRPGLRVKSFFFDVNEYGGSSDPETRRSSNQFFRAAKYGGYEADQYNTLRNPYNSWGNPFKAQDGSNNNDVWQDTDPRASRVGEANTYFLQSDARGVLSAFDDVFSRASTTVRSIAGSTLQSKKLTQAGNTLYQGTFDTGDWSGDLLAVPVTLGAGNQVGLGTSYTWTAAARLGALVAPATSRNIVVGNTGATANPTAAAFQWASIAASLQTALNKAAPAANPDNLGERRLNYLRGDRVDEGVAFRTRNKLLGDIINSGVVYSGAPSNSINSAGYASFYATNKDRTRAVFVGANDGMLHAFNATNGDELFGYIPSWLGSKLSALTNTAYANAHQSYVDGTPVVAEADLGDSATPNWKSVLVSGTGAGGRGVFALDVTNPAAFSASSVLWEFTNADDADLGNVVGRPQILKIRTNAAAATGTTPTYKYFAVFGSGVNNYVRDDAGIFSSTGNPALFLLDLSKPAGTAWTLGSNYYKVSLPTDATVSASKATGLVNFRAALGSAGEVTQAYMGDLHGKLWKLDFTTQSVATWDMDHLSFYKAGTVAIPMFIAKDTSGNLQPISATPSLVYGSGANANGSSADTTSVVFGTGKYLEVTDRTDASTQSIYMLFDNGSATPDTTPASSATSAISSRLRLKLGSVNASTGVVTTPAFTLGRATTNVDTEALRSGWVFDLPGSKERQVSSASVFGDKLFFGSLVPNPANTSTCEAAGGGGVQYTVNAFTGSGTSIRSAVGTLGELVVAELSDATTYSASDSTGRRIKTVTNIVVQQGSDGIGSGGSSTRTVVTGRLSWRQINNYQDPRN